MSTIFFFSIPAYGHINPTLAVAAELVRRGQRVRYYAFEEFREKIEATGAEYVACDAFLPPAPADLSDRVGRDFASLMEMVVDTTLNLEPLLQKETAECLPDCIVSDSVCFWGKLFAQKYGVPLVCSTTTMAFNRASAKWMKQSPWELLRMAAGLPRIGAKFRQLQAHGYDAKHYLALLQNDNDTDTIVYTSRRFQPAAETFSDRYAFVGPSIARHAPQPDAGPRQTPQVYISLGTVLNDAPRFYRMCMDALGGQACRVILSAGRQADPKKWGDVPENFAVYPYVDQMKVLASADVFLTHCGMNSVQESLYMGVPMVLYPQHAEENAVALRAEQLGAGLRLKRVSPEGIRRAVRQVWEQPSFKRNAQAMRADFLACGGAAQAADLIEQRAAGAPRPLHI